MARSVTTGSRQPVVSASRHAAIYTRISDDKEGLALGVQRQREDCEAKAEAHGLTVVAEFEDNDISASTRSRKRRPSYEDMLDRARRGEFGTIIAYSNSRITRRPRELEDLIALHERHGTVIRTVVSGDDDLSKADGRMVARIKAAVDAAEAERVGERVERSARQRVEMGRWYGGVPPFGFRKEDKTLHVNEPEAALVREAATRILERDDTVYGVVKDWQARGILTRGHQSRPPAPWRHSVLQKVLTNPALIGTNSAGVEDCWTPILDRETFALLTERLAPDSSRRTNPLGVKSSKYALGGGLVRCGRCGKPLHPVARKDIATKLICRAFVNGDHENHPKREDGTSEGRVSVDAATLEDYLMVACIDHLADVPYWDSVRRRRAEADSDLARLNAERDARQGERDRAGRAFIAGIMSESEAQGEVARLDAELERLQTAIDRAHGEPLAVDVWGPRAEALERWREWESHERREFFRDLVSSVTVGDWPEGIPTTTLPRRGESSKAFEARRAGASHEAMLKRVDIAWL